MCIRDRYSHDGCFTLRSSRGSGSTLSVPHPGRCAPVPAWRARAKQRSPSSGALHPRPPSGKECHLNCTAGGACLTPFRAQPVPIPPRVDSAGHARQASQTKLLLCLVLLFAPMCFECIELALNIGLLRLLFCECQIDLSNIILSILDLQLDMHWSIKPILSIHNVWHCCTNHLFTSTILWCGF